MIEFYFSHSPSKNIPSQILDQCRSGDFVWRIKASGDESSIFYLEETAKHRTKHYGRFIDNDIGRPGVCDISDVARIVHALEHLIVLHLVDTGEISLEELKIGSGKLALTVPGSDKYDLPIAFFWLNNGLVSFSRIDGLLLNSQQVVYKAHNPWKV